MLSTASARPYPAAILLPSVATPIDVHPIEFPANVRVSIATGSTTPTLRPSFLVPCLVLDEPGQDWSATRARPAIRSSLE